MARLGTTVSNKIDPEADIRQLVGGLNDNFSVTNQMLQKLVTEANNVREQVKLAPLSTGDPFLFGDGSNGDLHVTSGTTTLSTSQLIRRYKNLTVDSGAVLTASRVVGAGHIIFASESIYIAGTLNWDALGGTPGIAVTGLAVGQVAANYTLSLGGTGGGGGAPNGVAGAQGGDNQLLAGGAAGAAANGNGGAGNAMSQLLLNRILWESGLKDDWHHSIGTGGGGGGADTGGGNSGAGGTGGGALILMAPVITIAAGGVISLDGAAGGDASGADAGGGGGGGGGFNALIGRTINTDGTVAAAAGAGGDGTGGSGDGGAGGSGTLISVSIP